MTTMYQPDGKSGSANRSVADHATPRAVSYSAVPVLQKEKAPVQPRADHTEEKTPQHSHRQIEKNAVNIPPIIQRKGIWDEAGKPFGSKSALSPAEYADSLGEASEEFSRLREEASGETKRIYGDELTYEARPQKGGGMSEAYFKDGTAYFNMDGHPAMILANIIFETANAAQSGRFLQVESDYDSGAILNKMPSDYEVDDLGDALNNEYQTGDKATRRVIIQERFEWQSFIKARPAFLKVKGEMEKTKESKEMYDVYFAVFDDILQIESFEEYYGKYGRTHRGQVEGVIRAIENKTGKKNKKRCYLTTACVQAKGLPDDCEELTVLRHFRDDYILKKPNGAALVQLYYQYAPQIVSAIHRRNDEEEILRRLYGIIRDCVYAIKTGDHEYAFQTYCKMVIELKREFLPESVMPLSE